MPLDLLAQPEPAPPPRRFVDERGGTIALVVVDGGDSDIIGPITSHDEALHLARTLLDAACDRAPLPVAVHKLALAYLALSGTECLAPVAAPRVFRGRAPVATGICSAPGSTP